jgi:hypothetical protein
MEAVYKETVRGIKVASYPWCFETSYQAMVWYQCPVPYPELPLATHSSWTVEGDVMVPTTTYDPPAPATVTHLVKCGCKTSKCQSHCSCRSHNLNFVRIVHVWG